MTKRSRIISLYKTIAYKIEEMEHAQVPIKVIEEMVLEMFLQGWKDIENNKKRQTRLYWFLYNNFGKLWNDFKVSIGRPSDPWWIRWLTERFLME